MPQYVGEAPCDCKESRLAGGVGDDQELTDVGSVLTILMMLPPAARRRPCRETERARAHAELSILKQITEAANGSWRLPPGTLSAHIRNAMGCGRAQLRWLSGAPVEVRTIPVDELEAKIETISPVE